MRLCGDSNSAVVATLGMGLMPYIQVEPMEPVDEDGFNWAKMLESASPSFRKAWEEGLAKCSPLAILPQQPSLHEKTTDLEESWSEAMCNLM